MNADLLYSRYLFEYTKTSFCKINKMCLANGIFTAIFRNKEEFEKRQDELATAREKLMAEIERRKELVMSVPGVKFCHAVRSCGRPDAFFIDVHVGVDPKISVQEARDQIAHLVKLKLKEVYIDFQCANVQIEPDTEAARFQTNSVFRDKDY